MTGKRLVAVAVVLLVGAAVGAGLLLSRGKQQEPQQTGAAVQRPRPARRVHTTPASWPLYGFDAGRTHAAAFALRPPFRTLWAVHPDSSFIEFPPVLDEGRLFFGTNHGLVLAVEAATGRVAWHRQFAGCVAASPAVAKGVVYLGFMDPPPCRSNGSSFLAALDARTGRTIWRFRSGVVEASPLLAGGRVYFGSWDHYVYALDARTGRLEWRFATGGKVKDGAAFARGTIYVGSYDGRLYALDARSGRLRWSAGGLGGVYATPSVAGGRVVVGSTNGSVYAFAAGSGRLLWTLSTGSYVYSPAALANGIAYIGSYDHRFYALSQATGAIRWVFNAGAPISGAPTVLGSLVYFSTCGSCSSYESDRRARRTFALDARTGRVVWRFPDGEYSPVIADRTRLYLTGFTSLYGMIPRTGG